MAFPSITYTLTNGTTADATQVQQNFQDLINGFSDGTKDLNMASGTFSGTLSISGSVTLGLSSSNLVTFNGSLNTSIALSTTNTFDIGSDPFGLASIYLGSGSSAHSTRLKGAAVLAAYTFTLPLSGGSSGQILQTDGSGATSFVNNPRSSSDAQNLAIASSVSGNALTVALKGQDGNDASATNRVDVNFRNATSATGTPTLVSLSAALSLVVASGATLGHVSAAQCYIYVYVINNAGTMELAISSTGSWDEGTVQTTTALSGSSNSSGILYSTVSRSNVAIRLIGRLSSTQTTAGTWATGVSEISLFPFRKLKNSHFFVDTGNNYGSSNTKVRRFTNVRASVGTDLTYTDSSTLGGFITVNSPGLYFCMYSDTTSSTDCSVSIVINGSAGTNSNNSLTYSQGYRGGSDSPTPGQPACHSIVLPLVKDDIIWCQTNTGNNTNTNQTLFSVTKLFEGD